MSKRLFAYLFTLTMLFNLVACNNEIKLSGESDGKADATIQLEEHSLVELPLFGEAGDAENEYSGLAWWNDSLILLPQYPSGI